MLYSMKHNSSKTQKPRSPRPVYRSVPIIVCLSTHRKFSSRFMDHLSFSHAVTLGTKEMEKCLVEDSAKTLQLLRRQVTPFAC